jgi:hypothetical protein
MTPKQALTKANKLWGKGKELYSAGGHINKRAPYSFETKRTGYISVKHSYDVGFVSNLLLPMFHVKGTGESWEQAFADAERKAELDRQSIAEARARVAAKKAAALNG